MRMLGSSVLGDLGAAAALALLLSTTGCYTLGSDCDLNFNCTGGSGGSGASGGTGGVGGAPPGCVPSNNSSPIDESCGVFVSSSKGEDTNAGTKDKPFATLAVAFSAANGKPVYLCGETFLENVEINASALIYGGLDCKAAWSYDAAKPSELTASSDFNPLRVSAQTSVELHDVNVTASDATIPGGSSVAIIAEGEASVKLVRSRIHAGSGADGENGDDFLDLAAAGGAGLDGGMACSANQVITLDAPTNTCGDVQSIGGAAGNGLQAAGGAGTPGLPDGAMNAGVGEGGSVCTPGTVGDPGPTGIPGDGAMSLGAIQAGVGFAGASGADGKPGAPAQGGGGGGGAKGGTGTGKCGAGSAGGASGGTGASGGCGGLGGKGGTAGGASIGIISLGATLSFTDVTIELAAGGKGGNGGAGQSGGLGGTGGLGGSKGSFVNLNNGCKGGDGGRGGDGGKGGGGRGGHSLGIAYKGTAPEIMGATITPGAAGNGGTGEGATGEGAPGVAVAAQGF